MGRLFCCEGGAASRAPGRRGAMVEKQGKTWWKRDPSTGKFSLIREYAAFEGQADPDPDDPEEPTRLQSRPTSLARRTRSARTRPVMSWMGTSEGTVAPAAAAADP